MESYTYQPIGYVHSPFKDRNSAPKVYTDSTGPLTGVFATRSTRRPNLIGVSIIKIVDIKDTTITFTGVDTLDGTPVLDLKLAD